MYRCEIHGTEGAKPLYERLLALPGQAILTAAALPVLAPILLAKGVKRAASLVKARRGTRARHEAVRVHAADTTAGAERVHVRLLRA